MSWISQKWALYNAGRKNGGMLDRIQQQRLQDIVGYAKNHSSFYRQLYRQIDLPLDDLRRLPPVSKPELMANFDAWVTDPRISLAGIKSFLASEKSPAQRFLDHYSVWTTSGTTGDPGIFMHDSRAQSIYNDLILFRAYPAWLNLRQVATLLRRGFRYTLIIATGGPYAGVSSWEQVRQRLGRHASVLSTLSIELPLPELVRQLNEIRPVVLASYPSVLRLLAGEQAEGRLRLRPEMLACTGEWLDPAARLEIEQAFAPGRLVELYGASEFPYLATSCRHKWLHLNSDWAILEPVDRDGQPVPPGQPSHSLLLTNLANRIQPILRYNLGDSIVLRSEPCECGSRLPALRVEGRQDEILTLQSMEGDSVRLLPMALATPVETAPGVNRYQIVQTAPDELEVRLEPVPGSDRQQVWIGVVHALEAYLTEQGLSGIRLSLSRELPHPDPRSGKFRMVWSQIKEQA